MIEKINIDICAFLNFWVWEKKGSRIFFWAIGIPKKLKNFKKYWKTPYRRVAQKRYNFSPSAANHTFFFTNPVYLHTLIGHFLVFVETLISKRSPRKKLSFIESSCESLNLIFKNPSNENNKGETGEILLKKKIKNNHKQGKGTKKSILFILQNRFFVWKPKVNKNLKMFS